MTLPVGLNGWYHEPQHVHLSGQIIIFHQPRFPWNSRSHFPYYSPPFAGNRSCFRSRANLTRLMPFPCLHFKMCLSYLRSSHSWVEPVFLLRWVFCDEFLKFPKNDHLWSCPTKSKFIKKTNFLCCQKNGKKKQRTLWRNRNVKRLFVAGLHELRLLEFFLK